MLRSLFTGISGLSAHQEMLDVTANNIANVNTTGFKSSSVQFEDTLSQTISGGGAATTTTGGTDPVQVGLGVQVAGTSLNFTQGSSQATGVPSNMLINGDGFFTVQKNGQTLYTRNGNFTTDDQGHLVLPDGAELVGTTTTPGTPPTTTTAPIVLPLTTNTPPGKWVDYNIGADGTITGVDTNGNPVDVNGDPITATSPSLAINLATFANPNGLEKAGDTEFIQTAASGAPSTTAVGTVTTGYVEMSNVDLASQLTNLIISERGFQANSKVITTSDQILQTLVSMTN
jgi:flagellar hook protein FlgE